MTFSDELQFEKELINILTSSSGWEKTVLKNKTEDELIQNWADILFQNNNSINRLNGYPLTKGEMHQLIEQINNLKTPLKLNGFINGKTVLIKRDNEDDKQHFGKEISLKIYDRDEISAGQSRYQIVEQPIFKPKNPSYPSRRGDFTLLINGMPLIHVELKKSGVPISKAENQIKLYAHEGVFTGLFSLVQIFVVMTPEECKYFSNPGPEGKFNPDFYFHWADFNNNPIDNYKGIAEDFLHIPLAHELIGYYTVADNTDGILKVMRSYQIRAARGIADRVKRARWDEKDRYGGYVRHTTGSGKTMTSFKSANLIANSKDADKVVFLMDRIELGTQSLQEYRNFADDATSVQQTEDTYILLGKLKSADPKDTLIVTSIQKMSNIQNDSAYNQKDIEIIRRKRLVFVIDECHRSTFGDMLAAIKETFPRAVFFGFTGTPIHEENKKKDTTTSMIFGPEIHRYSIADGIRDKNVLGFDKHAVFTYKDSDIRKAVALQEAKAKDEDDAYANEEKLKVFNRFMNKNIVPKEGRQNEKGIYIKGIEDYIPSSQYDCDKHRNAVVEDILHNWKTLSKNSKYHAILATSSIPEAIKYYELLKYKVTGLKATALFDASSDHEDGEIPKIESIIKMIDDYNELYGTTFSYSSYGSFKKDVCQRLAHKKPYLYITGEPEKQLNILIVVNQMLTGFDSKWLNSLYLDKILKYEGIIQAFSRTNRLSNIDEKPFGLIIYYRKPYTMENNIETAFGLYSGDKPLGLFADKLDKRLLKMNYCFDGDGGIKEIFDNAGIIDFKNNPKQDEELKKFAKLFSELHHNLEAAKLQSFVWDKDTYDFKDKDGKKFSIKLDFDERIYLTLLQRYKELLKGNGPSQDDVPYDIDTYITEIDTGVIDSEWMNQRFTKYIKARQTGVDVEKMRAALSQTFPTLSQEKQKYANLFLHDIDNGDVEIIDGKSLSDYITEYQTKAKNDQIHELAVQYGIIEEKLREIMKLSLNASNIDEFGELDRLKEGIDYKKAKETLDKKYNTNFPPFKVRQKVDELLRDFIIMGGYDL